MSDKVPDGGAYLHSGPRERSGTVKARTKLRGGSS